MHLSSLGFRNSFRRPARTGLSIFGIALCVMLILTMAAVSQRYTSVVSETYSIYSSNVVVISKTSLLVEGLPLGGALPNESISLIESVQGVKSVTPILIVVDLKQGALIPTNITIGVPIQNFSMFQKTSPIALKGSYPSSGDQVVVGSYLAQIAKLTTGSIVRAGNTSLLVSGIMDTSNFLLNSAIIMPLSTAQSTQGYTGLVSAILVSTSKSTQSNTVIQNINSQIPGVSAIDPQQSDFATSPLVSSIGTLSSGVDIFSLVLAFLFVAIISSVNIIEKKDELRTMQSIGSSFGSIQKVTLAETGAIGMIGVLIGLLLSTIATAFLFQVYGSAPIYLSILTTFTVIPITTILYASFGVLGLSLLIGGIITNAVLRKEI